jgi:hypothetical protein
MHPRFLQHFGIALAVAAAVLGAFSWLLYQIGELGLPRVISRQQQDHRILFTSGIHGDYFEQKVQLHRHLQPVVVALGSSRAMQVRGEFFTVGFVNWGGAVSSVGRLEQAVRVLSMSPRPQLALLLVDPWWFNARLRSSDDMAQPPAYPSVPDPGTFYEAARILVQQRDRLGAAAARRPTRLGLLAAISNEGFDRFGSYHYVSTITGAKQAEDVRFADTADRIAKGRSRFEHATEPDEALLHAFLSAVGTLRASGVRVILAEAPFANAVNRLLDQHSGYAYIRAVRRFFSTVAEPLHDYASIAPLQQLAQPDCEFLDGFHAGDVAHARILKDLASREPDVARFVNMRYLDDMIAAHAGKAQAPSAYHEGAREIDFLQIGCTK